MLLGVAEQIEEIIVRLLGQHPQSPAADLHRIINSTFKRCTLKAVYKALGKLEAGGVVIKLRRNYSLSLSWVIEMLTMLQSGYEKSVTTSVLKEILKRPGGKKKWKFNTLAQLNPFWVHLILAFASISRTKIIFDWTWHPWFYLIQPQVEDHFNQALRAMDVRVYRIVGGSSYLDKLPLKIWKRIPGRTVFAKGPFLSEHKYDYSIIGNTTIRVTLPPELLEEVDRLYGSSRIPAEFDLAAINSILHRRAPIILEAISSRKHTGALANKFRKFFNIK